MTKGRCQQFGYWVTSKGAFMDVDEMMKLQGLGAVKCEWQSTGITPSNFAGCLGNTMSLNVLSFLVPQILEFSNLVPGKRAAALVRKASNLFPVAC